MKIHELENNKMSLSYLKFDKTRMVNLEYSLNMGILRTNRRGAYHSTTLVECNTRKQHGLLVIPVPKLDEENHVLLSSLDETVIQHGAEFNLGIHKYSGDNYSPMGHKYIREFDCESCPKTVYRIGGVILSKEKLFALDENLIFIRYTLIDAHSPTTLRFRPYLAFRSIHALTEENPSANLTYKIEPNGISMCLYEKYPTLYMQFSKENEFNYNPVWYKGIEYKQDLEDGLQHKEDLPMPGYFEMPIEKGESIIFAAGDKCIEDTSTLHQQFEENMQRRTPRSSFYNCLRNSANQLYVRPNEEELFILEGYPWFHVNAREQFMSLPGLTLCCEKESAFEKVIDSALPYIKAFMKDETHDGILKNIGDPDVPLWCMWALKKYALVNPQACYDKYAWIVKDTITYLLKNKHPNLHLAENKLLYTHGRDKAVSWMKGIVNGYPIVPRSGYLVEFNALWYNALMFYHEILEHQKNKAKMKEIYMLSEEVKGSFLETFFNDAGYLYDYVDDNSPNWAVRPSMIIAISVDYSMLTRRQSKKILDLVTKELLTPKGIRTLSPKGEGYHPYFGGDHASRTHATYNGTCTPAFFAPFFEAYIKVYQRSAFSFIERTLISIEEEMTNNCIGTLSQVYDGNPPYSGHGGFSYSTSIASILRTLEMKNNLEESCSNDYYY